MTVEQPSEQPSDGEQASVGLPAAEAPEPARWEPPESTGIVAVDEALRSLSLLDTLPMGAHVEHYEAVHRRLQDALADLDGS